MSKKIRHLVSDSKNLSLRNRGKVFSYKKQIKKKMFLEKSIQKSEDPNRKSKI